MVIYKPLTIRTSGTLLLASPARYQLRQPGGHEKYESDNIHKAEVMMMRLKLMKKNITTI